MNYELITHTADLKLRSYGATLEKLFRNTLYGMFASIHPLSNKITYHANVPTISSFSSEHTIALTAPDKELLLVDFLSECLYLSDVHNEAYFDIKYSHLSDTTLKGTVYGVPIDGFKVVEIKAVTYHELSITKDSQGWQATVVFDI